MHGSHGWVCALVVLLWGHSQASEGHVTRPANPEPNSAGEEPSSHINHYFFHTTNHSSNLTSQQSLLFCAFSAPDQICCCCSFSQLLYSTPLTAQAATLRSMDNVKDVADKVAGVVDKGLSEAVALAASTASDLFHRADELWDTAKVRAGGRLVVRA